MPVGGHEVEPLQMNGARDAPGARVAAGVGAVPLAGLADVQEYSIGVAHLPDAVVERTD